MKIRIKYFASAKDKAGSSEEILEFDKNPTVNEVKERLVLEHPNLEQLLLRCRIAVSGRLVSRNELVKDGSEIAILPPISGG